VSNEQHDPIRDPGRIAAVRATRVLESSPESLDRITQLTAEVLSAPIALIDFVDEDFTVCKSCVGLPQPWAAKRLMPHTLTLCPEVVRSGRPILVDDTTVDPRYRHLPAVTDLGAVAYAGVPLRTSDGHVIGTLCVIDKKPRKWGRRDLRILQSLASMVLTEIRLDAEIRRGDRLTGEQAARKEAEAGRRRAALLAEASRVFASTLDYQATLQSVANVVVPELADICIIDIKENGDFRRVASVHADPEINEILRDLERFPPSGKTENHVTRVMRAGVGRIVRMDSEEARRRAATSPEHLEIIRKLDPRIGMVIPLVARGRTLGVVHLVATRTDRSYGTEDLAFAHDLLDRAALSIENARLYEQAVEANAARTNFLAVMSHELRTPLTAVLGYADLLAEEIDGPLTEAQRHKLSRIRVSAKHLLELIDEILAFTRMESGTLVIDRSPVDLTAVARDAEGVIRPAAEAKGLDFDVRLPTTPVRTSTDSAKVRRILLNLLSNAVRFTDSGSVELRLDTRDHNAYFEVRDTGSGISEEHQKKMFEPFWQAAEPMTRTTGGTGLGLPVALNLARMLDGDVTVRSRPGEGSTFTVRIPIVPPESAQAAA